MYKKDIKGQRFGRLTVLDELPEQNRKRVKWRCRCDCGKQINVLSVYLLNGDTESCGCIKKEQDQHNLRDQYDAQRVNGVNVSLLKSKIRVDNKSGVKGVSIHKATGKWDASIGVKGKQIHLGRFKNLNDAINARKNAEIEYHQPLINKKEGNENE